MSLCGVQNLKLKADARAEHKQFAHDKRQQTFQQKVGLVTHVYL